MPVIIVGILVVLLLGFFAATRLRGQSSSVGVETEDLGAEARWLLRPIRELRQNLESLANQGGTAGMLAREAVSEADAILERSSEMLKLRTQLKQSLKRRGEAETHLGRIQRELPTAKSEPERQALESALESRQRELQAYDRAQGRIDEIDGRIKEAEAALAELKARLAVGVLDEAQSQDDTEFQQMMVRLRSLGQSFDEVRDTLEVKPQ